MAAVELDQGVEVDLSGREDLNRRLFGLVVSTLWQACRRVPGIPVGDLESFRLVIGDLLRDGVAAKGETVEPGNDLVENRLAETGSANFGFGDVEAHESDVGGAADRYANFVR